MSVAENKAVFLSYASQDADAARRICEALRAAGVEVWFDQNELVGGDAWDAKIRKQIKECALFVPVISANTQARREGYFRREWKQAAERTRDMAEGTPFLLPVVIDDTADRGALVPEEFRVVQWTRLCDEVTDTFCALVQAMLAGPVEARTLSSASSPLRPGATPLPRRPSRVRWLLAGGIVLAVACVALLFWHRPAAQVVAPGSTEKSIAVLPFVNMSADKENEYLSDGLTEEILNSLVKIPGLRVPARTSSFVFKDRKDDIKKIGELLGVKTVLEGSVRRSGNQLRITAQLINVADGYHLWSETYDRDMTNIFAIQDDIARTVVAKLKISLGAYALRSARWQNNNVEAYEDVLKGRFHSEKVTEGELNIAITHFKNALLKEPDYALAYAGLSEAYGYLRYWHVRPSTVTPQMQETAQKAIALDDTLSEAHVALAAVYFYVERNWAAAEKEFRRAIELDSTHARARTSYATFLLAVGRYDEAQSELTRALRLDPLSMLATSLQGWLRLQGGDFDGALGSGRAALALAPEFFHARQVTALALYRKGLAAQAVAELEATARIASPPETVAALGSMYARVGRKREAQKVLEGLLRTQHQRYVPSLALALLHCRLGNTQEADECMAQAIAEKESRLVFLKTAVDEATTAHPHYRDWLNAIGLKP